ncbi:hypothetical protein NUU61_006562 [Penicillium alfredii]|uniref:Uncharacterized protein n=1 Tax=Penicillium alfredii TaxID=1506179 RepID=A0A9W9F157_9EURO|nr:uncharacterized protein NUU61_006562 [Penicillium alfredii]KAJ5091692.1 hypothetical protein NUU61_006562 [Penicillium alfredii]
MASHQTSADNVPPKDLTDSQIAKDAGFNNIREFMISYGLNPANTKDVVEAREIMQGFREMYKNTWEEDHPTGNEQRSRMNNGAQQTNEGAQAGRDLDDHRSHDTESEDDETSEEDDDYESSRSDYDSEYYGSDDPESDVYDSEGGVSYYDDYTGMDDSDYGDVDYDGYD